MSLKDNLNALIAAVGDAKVLFATAFVLQKNGRMWATNGGIHASLPNDGGLFSEYCVNAELLRRASTHEGTTVEAGKDADHVIVRYPPRGRLRLNALKTEVFPLVVNNDAPEQVSRWMQLPPFWRETVEFLNPYTGDGKQQAWMAGIHFEDDFVWACAPECMSRVDFRVEGAHPYTLPAWLIEFVLKQENAPIALHVGEKMISLAWETGLVVHGAKMSDSPSEQALSMATNLGSMDGLVERPEGMLEAVQRINAFGAKVLDFTAEGMRAKIDDTGNMVEEDIELPWKSSKWNISRLLPLLKECHQIKFENNLCHWSAADRCGVLAGMIN